MQGAYRTPPSSPDIGLPIPNRVKRGRTLTPELDVDLDCYFRTKRFMADSVSKEMEDVSISDPPTLITSPSRTSTLSRLAERGPSHSSVASVLDFDAPRLSIGSNSGRRRHMIVRSASDVPSPRNGDKSEGSLSGSGGMKLSDFDDEDEDEEEEITIGPTIEWRFPPSSPRTTIPRPIPVEETLQRLIEKKKEAETKQVILYRSPSEIIKGAAQNALYQRLRSNNSGPDMLHTFRSSFPRDVSSDVPFSADSRYPPPQPTLTQPSLSFSVRPSPKSSLIVEELPDEPTNTPPMTPNQPASPPHPLRRSSYTDFMITDDNPGTYTCPSQPTSPGRQTLRTSGTFSRAAAMQRGGSGFGFGQNFGFGGSGFGGASSSMSTSPRTPPSSPAPPRFSMFSDYSMETDDGIGMEISSTPPPPAQSNFMSANGGFTGYQ